MSDITPYIHCLDTPLWMPAGDNVHIAGWIVGPKKIQQVYVKRGNEIMPIPVDDTGRVDVRKAYPDVAFVHGFNGVVPSACIVNNEIHIFYRDEFETHSFTKPLLHSINLKNKSEKLDKILSILKTNLTHTRNSYNFNFLTSALRQDYNIISTDAVSSNDYDPIALSIINKYSGGLVLDAGAGFRNTYYPNVVNFEIVAYPSTDVVGVGEELPFKDNSFEAVFSLAVLEHVKDPFRCAAEIKRVLKPNGELYAVVPFLQPYHGYPSHYYNMTHQGLANLFPGMEIIEQEIIASGLPIWTLTWFLKNYCDGLPERVAERFQKMRISDLICDPKLLLDKDYVTCLSKEKKFELACTTMLRAKK